MSIVKMRLSEMQAPRFEYLRCALGISAAEAFGLLALFWHRTQAAGLEVLPAAGHAAWLPALPNTEAAQLLTALSAAGYLADCTEEGHPIIDNAGCAASKEARQAKARKARAAVGQTKRRRAPAAPKPKALERVDTDGLTSTQRANRATWEAYSTAYMRKIHQAPVRNAKANALIAQFVQRIGAAEAPHVIGFFVDHPNSQYMQRLYPLELAVRDAEGLRTQWANGQPITQGEVRAYDRDYQFELTRRRIEAGQI